MLIIDNAPRNLWVMSRVIKTFPDKHGLTRSAKVHKPNILCALVLFLSCAHYWKPNVYKFVLCTVYQSAFEFSLCLCVLHLYLLL